MEEASIEAPPAARRVCTRVAESVASWPPHAPGSLESIGVRASGARDYRTLVTGE